MKRTSKEERQRNRRLKEDEKHCNMDMSALLKSENSTSSPSGRPSVKSTGTERRRCQPVIPAHDESHIYYMRYPHNATLKKHQAGRAKSQQERSETVFAAGVSKMRMIRQEVEQCFWGPTPQRLKR